MDNPGPLYVLDSDGCPGRIAITCCVSKVEALDELMSHHIDVSHKVDCAEKPSSTHWAYCTSGDVTGEFPFGQVKLGITLSFYVLDSNDDTGTSLREIHGGLAGSQYSYMTLTVKSISIKAACPNTAMVWWKEYMKGTRKSGRAFGGHEQDGSFLNVVTRHMYSLLKEDFQNIKCRNSTEIVEIPLDTTEITEHINGLSLEEKTLAD